MRIAKNWIKQQLEQPDFLRPECKGSYARSMGAPCSHMIMDIVRRDGVVLPSMYDKHWHLASLADLQNQAADPPIIREVDVIDMTGIEDDGPNGVQPEYLTNSPLVAHKGAPPRFKNVQRVYEDGRRAPTQPTNDHSTQRNPSVFEYAEGVPKRRRLCGLCAQSGHNRTTCPRMRAERALGGNATLLPIKKENIESSVMAEGPMVIA